MLTICWFTLTLTLYIYITVWRLLLYLILLLKEHVPRLHCSNPGNLITTTPWSPITVCLGLWCYWKWRLKLKVKSLSSFSLCCLYSFWLYFNIYHWVELHKHPVFDHICGVYMVQREICSFSSQLCMIPPVTAKVSDVLMFSFSIMFGFTCALLCSPPYCS